MTHTEFDLHVGGLQCPETSPGSRELQHLQERITALEGQIRLLTPALDAKLVAMRRETSAALQTLDMKTARTLRNQRPAPSE